jgi:plastocyanin
MLFSMRYALPARTHTLSEVTLSVPGFLDTGKEDVFVVETTLDPSLYDVSWELGDGRMTTGQAIRHTYRQAGIYTVVARVSGPRKRIVLQSRVNVRDRVEPPRITTISHSPYAGFPGDTIRFEADLTGTDGQCLWAFGDGSSATTCRADHVFEAPGTYRVLLSVTNAAGSDTKTRTVRIASDACAGREMLAAVHFRRNSQELVLDMREILRDNFAVASRCPDRTLVVSGFAFDTEQQAEELALGRARAVMQYYRNLGMPTRSVQLGRAIVQSEEGWLDEPWEGRKVSSALTRE